MRQSKKKLKGNTNKMLEAKKLNIISKTILAGKEKNNRMRNSRGVFFSSPSTDVPSPSPSTDVTSPSSSTGVPSPTSFTGVQSVPLSKDVLDGVPGSQAKKITQKKNIVTGLQNQKNITFFSNLDEHKFSTFSFGFHSSNGQKIADSPFPSCS